MLTVARTGDGARRRRPLHPQGGSPIAKIGFAQQVPSRFGELVFVD
jgi:hypothetical protein